MYGLQEALRLRPYQSIGDNHKRRVFVCVDCEAYEFAQDKITEVGICVLDTADLTPENLNTATGEFIWPNVLKSAHFIVNEYKHLVNKRFVRGHPDKFSFGTTQQLPLAIAANMLRRLFQDPTQLDDLMNTLKTPESDLREIVLVGHGISSDVEYLKNINFDAHQVKNIVSTADTHRILGKTGQTSLARLLTALNFNSVEDVEQQLWLHNAGNDAVWTMKALVMLVSSHFATYGLCTGKPITWGGWTDSCFSLPG
jgi:DNA polymerase III epsilon subunit-like protein